MPGRVAADEKALPALQSDFATVTPYWPCPYWSLLRRTRLPIMAPSRRPYWKTHLPYWTDWDARGKDGRFPSDWKTVARPNRVEIRNCESGSGSDARRRLSEPSTVLYNCPCLRSGTGPVWAALLRDFYALLPSAWCWKWALLDCVVNRHGFSQSCSLSNESHLLQTSWVCSKHLPVPLRLQW